MPGIGKGIAGIICDILERGTFDKRDQLLAKYPPTALELLKIQGLGPKSIALLIEHFRVSTVDDLERHLPGAEAAHAAAHGREARREGAALHSAVSQQLGPLPAAVCADVPPMS